jgi:DnaJ-class molecular chaperone
MNTHRVVCKECDGYGRFTEHDPPYRAYRCEKCQADGWLLLNDQELEDYLNPY